MSPTHEPRPPRRIGHRGVSGHHPENSLEAFRAAKPAGLDAVELDLHSTTDGVFLVHHDPEVRGFGPIATSRHADFAAARLPNGEPIPTIEQALDAVDELAVWIEVKTLDPRFDGRLVDAIRAAGQPDRFATHSFDHRIVARLRRQAPWLRIGILSVSYPIDPVAELRAADASTYWMEHSMIDQDLVTQVHRAGGEVIAWTVNDRTLAARLARLGVDGLCGNYPERLDGG